MKKILLLLTGLLVALLVTAVVAQNYQRPVRTISVEDDSGRLLVYYRLPRRIVVLDPVAGRMLLQLSAGERVVGAIPEAAVDFPQAERLDQLAELRPAAVAALRPQLVLAGRQTSALAAELARNGVNVFLVDPPNLETLVDGFARLGKLLGQGERGHSLSLELKQKLQDLATSGAKRPKGVVCYLDQQLTAAGQGTLESDLLGVAGASNLLSAAGYRLLSPDEAQLLNPEVLLAPQALLVAPGQLATILPPASGQETSWPSGPKGLALPEDFWPLTWENILARADWLRQQLGAAGG